MDDSLFFKILVVGDSGVGKTSFLSRICSKKLSYDFEPTIGCDYGLKVLKNFSGHQIRLQIWEVAGHDKYVGLSRLYFKGASGVIVVSDITKSESLNSSFQWIQAFKENEDLVETEDIPIILLQNKTDLLSDSEAKDLAETQHVRELAIKNGFTDCFQVSIKYNENLEEVVRQLVQEILQKPTLESNSISEKEIEEIEEHQSLIRSSSTSSIISYQSKTSQISKRSLRTPISQQKQPQKPQAFCRWLCWLC